MIASKKIAKSVFCAILMEYILEKTVRFLRFLTNKHRWNDETG
jgi:hypothetical protein